MKAKQPVRAIDAQGRLITCGWGMWTRGIPVRASKPSSHADIGRDPGPARAETVTWHRGFASDDRTDLRRKP